MSNDFKNIKENLKDFLSGCSSLVILAVGNDIRGDDGLGPYIVNNLSFLKEQALNDEKTEPSDNFEKNDFSKNENFHVNVDDINTGNAPLYNGVNFKKSDDVFESTSFDINNLYLVNGGSVPENFTSTIKNYDPSHIIIIDAVLMNQEPGHIQIVDKENISDVSISTHSMSLTYLIKFLELEKPFNILFIGIEPELMEISFELSDTVKKASDDLIDILVSTLNEL